MKVRPIILRVWKLMPKLIGAGLADQRGQLRVSFGVLKQINNGVVDKLYQTWSSV